MQPESKAESAPAPETRGFMEDLRALGAAVPHKALFAGLAVALTALFHFYGNPTLGYVNTPSMFLWLQNSYAHAKDDNFGTYIPFVVLALFWWKREELIATPKRLWWPPVALFAFGLLLHLVGYTVQQTRLSVVGYFFSLYAIIGMLWGWKMLRTTFFPFFLFWFMMPLVGEMESLTLPLRHIATKITVLLSHAGGIDVVQKGTLIENRNGHFSYNVEAACSGLRSLTTMLMLGCIFGFTAFQSNWKRAALIASAVPLAICGNVIRLLGVVVSASWKFDQMIQAKQPVRVAGEAAQALGEFVHQHSLLKLMPYIPAFIGMMLLARWLREDHERGEGGALVSRPVWVMGAVVLGLTAAAAAFLATQQARQKLGTPGVRLEKEPLYKIDPGATTNPPVVHTNLQVFLPRRVLDFQSQAAPMPTTTVDTLPPDTLYGHRMYGRTNGFGLDFQVVLMGSDRSSIHKPQYCLEGAGFRPEVSELTSIRVTQPHAYNLPVMKLKLRRQTRDENGRPRIDAAVYVYWFVADGELTAEHQQRMWWMARDMLKTGVLQRWAYVICWAPCAPGAEDATYEELKRFIAGAVPEFHLTTGRPVAERAALP